ncbi:AraC family transcriptional regulator [Bradyrhizobium sp. 14AA]
MDAIADVLASYRIGGAFLGIAVLRRPWGIGVDPQRNSALHVVLKGRCWLRLASGDEPIRLSPGDVVLVASGIGHALSDPSDAAIVAIREALSVAPSHETEWAPDATMLLCAKYQLDETGPHPMVSLMPPLIHLTARQVDANEPLRLVLQLLRVEAKGRRNGAEIIASRLLDSALVLLLRVWMDNQPAGSANWFGASSDPAIARALRLIHEQPQDDWTVATLADHALLSRATFARRFTQLIGEPPLAYVTRWRMSLAAKALRETGRSIDEIARAVGYESGPAFSKAFSRVFGRSPGRYRGGGS